MSKAQKRELLRQGACIHVAMLELDHPLGTGRFWSGTGDLEFEGQTYHGYGVLGSISEVAASTEVEIVQVSLTLSGVEPDLLKGLNQSIKNRTAKLYEAFLDDNYKVVERVLLQEIDLDTRNFKLDAKTGKATIAFVGHAGFRELANRSAAKWGPEEAKSIYSDETGFDEVHLQEDTQDVWRPE